MPYQLECIRGSVKPTEDVTPKKSNRSASDLRAAVDSNFDAVKKGLLEEGFSEDDIERARAELHMVNKEQGWY